MARNSRQNTESIIHEIYRSPHKINLKHDIVCRKIAHSIKANSVSILLYNGAENKLICRGRYIDPAEKRANAFPLNKTSAPSIIDIMNNVDVFEFFKMRGRTPELEMFSEYIKNPCCDKTIKTTRKFNNILKEIKNLLEFYETYKKCFIKERHPVGLSTSISGLFYYLLHHSNEDHLRLNKSNESIREVGGSIFSDTNICITNLSEKPSSLSICRTNLKEVLKIQIEEGGYYVGIPIEAPDNRLIGILRIVFGEETVNQISKLKIKSNKVKISSNVTIVNKIHEHLVRKVGVLRFASIIGEKLSYHELIEGFVKISLKRNLNQEFLEYNKLAEELAAVINCFGCVIRTSKGYHDAAILGYSKSVVDYVTDIKSTFDPYILDGKFKEPLVDIFYNIDKFNEDKSSIAKFDIISIKIQLSELGMCSITYQYINDKEDIIDSTNWPRGLKGIEKELKNIFINSLEKFNKYDIREVVIIPIKEIKYGFITLANKSVHPFVKIDFKMIIPVVRRVGFEYKQNQEHIQDKERLKQETLIHSTRIMFHQLGSPITSLRNHIINIRRKFIPEDKVGLRLQELELTYQDFLDMLGTNQFFFEYATKGITKLENTEFNPFEFVKERIRTYQLRAKKDRKLDIAVENDVFQKHGAISDKRLIGHVIQSLVDNAIKYSFMPFHREEPWFVNNPFLRNIPKWILVSVKNTATFFSISVTNWGSTIEEDEIDKIRTLEYRGKNSNQFASVGSGIGLYVVDLIVEKILGGKLEIEHTKENHKTIITVTFNKLIYER